ncbi:MAG: antitoxin component YwqK of YwqJK toxin-antitoxin module, partial [Patiriisocius sp.]
FKNGSVEEEGAWFNNRNVGSFVRFYKSGMVAQEFEFNQGGLRDGVQKYYYENGQMELIVNIKEGKEEGKMVRYYSSGDIKEEVKYDGGIVKEVTRKKFKLNQPEEKIVETPVVPVKLSKPVKVEEDKPNLSVFKSTGKNTLYNKNRLISQSGHFRNGRLWNGKWYKYDSNGLLTAIEIFKVGKFIGNGVIEENTK